VTFGELCVGKRRAFNGDLPSIDPAP